MSIAGDAIHVLRELSPRCQLALSLGCPQDRVTVYFAAPFRNTLGILKEGLRCKGDPSRTRGVDLSAHSIQVRRRTVWLGREGSKRHYDVHNCLNLLLNPLSETRQAFEKNALIARSLDPDAWPLCLLEYDLSALLESTSLAWGIADKNVAAGGYTVFTATDLQGPRFDWKTIYSTTGGAKSVRAAEVVLHLGASAISQPLPNSFLRRVLVRPSDCSELQMARLRAAAPHPVAIAHVPALDPDRGHLLRHETELLASDLCGPVAVACRDALVVEEEMQMSPALSKFLRKESGESWKHGQGHIVRVMIWSAYLARAAQVDDAHRCAAMAAAAIHDLDRLTDDADEPEHGNRAADRHRSHVSTWLGDDRLVEACLEAVRLHCLDDSECHNKDLLWSTLKDADALDRGRFSAPDDSEAKGCKIALLRNEDASRESAWVAYRLAKATAYLNWDEEQPVRSLCNYLTTACREVINLGVPAQVAAARRFLEELGLRDC